MLHLKYVWFFKLLVLLAGCASIRSAFESPTVRAVCHSDFAYSLGLQDGQSGDPDQKNLARGQVCSESAFNTTMFNKEYLAGYEKGLSTYCSDEGAQLFGQGRADEYSERRITAADFEVCEYNKARYAQLAQQAFHARLQQVCTVDQVTMRARQDARRSDPVPSDRRVFTVCSEKHSQLETAYQSAFSEEVSRIREEERLEREKERLRIEKERLEIERERLEMEKQMARQQRVDRGRFRFVVDEVQIESVCIFDQERGRAEVVVRRLLPERGSISFAGQWTISFYDDKERRLGTRTHYQSIYLFNERERSFSVSHSGRQNILYCLATYAK